MTEVVTQTGRGSERGDNPGGGVLRSMNIALLGISLNLEVVMQTGRESERGDYSGGGGGVAK